MTHHIIYTSFATRLRFDLYTFWEIFGWVWFWSFCVQLFWACKFTISLCLLLLVRRSEAKRVEESWDEERWGDESKDIFLVILWRSLWTSSFTIWRRSRCSFVLSSEALVWLTTKLLCVECVAVSTIAPVCHTKELCRIDLSQCSVIDRSSSVVWSFVLCELEFSSSSYCTLCVVRRA